MSDASQPALTPAGVRDGAPDALRALVARRGAAVLAYCATVCDPDVAPRAAAEAFARFRAAVAGAEDPDALAPEPLLLGATRHAAASMARTAPEGRGRRSLRPDRGADATCAEVPQLLVGRLEGLLFGEEGPTLEQHLARHAACREIEAGFDRAEAVYAVPPEAPLPASVERLVLAALVHAAPLAPGVAAAAALERHEEEQTARRAAQETQDWAAADVVAAVETVEPEPAPAEVAPEPAAVLSEPEPEFEPEPEPEPEAVMVAAVTPSEPAPDPEPRHGALAGLRARAGAFDLGSRPALAQWLLPGAAVLVALLVALGISGVFGGKDPAAPTGSQAVMTTAP